MKIILLLVSTEVKRIHPYPQNFGFLHAYGYSNPEDKPEIMKKIQKTAKSLNSRWPVIVEVEGKIIE